MNKDCHTCKHERLEIDQEPCARCFEDYNLPNWEEARPVALPEIVPYYERESSRIPERIRVSFSDGSTAIYDLRVDQPAPIIIENIKIIRRMAGYTAPRPRRRNRK